MTQGWVTSLVLLTIQSHNRETLLYGNSKKPVRNIQAYHKVLVDSRTNGRGMKQNVSRSEWLEVAELIAFH